MRLRRGHHPYRHPGLDPGSTFFPLYRWTAFPRLREPLPSPSKGFPASRIERRISPPELIRPVARHPHLLGGQCNIPGPGQRFQECPPMPRTDFCDHPSFPRKRDSSPAKAGAQARAVGTHLCRIRVCRTAKLDQSWRRIVGSLILSSSTSINALARMVESTPSPAKGNRRFAVSAGARSRTIQR